MQEDYCPIKDEYGKCEAGGECNHNHCWEKMHYQKTSEAFEKKMQHWIETKRGDASRWKNKT